MDKKYEIHELISNAHLAGQAEAGIDPSYSNAEVYAQQAIHSLQSQPDTAVRVCSLGDTVCGDNPKNWCSQCPLHVQWITPMQSQEAEPVATAEDAAKWIDARRDAYTAEHGSYDPSTNAMEYPGDGDHYVCELEEIAEGIRALSPPSQPPKAQNAEPWSGHKFKEVQRGVWKCKCGKEIVEQLAKAQIPAGYALVPIEPTKEMIDSCRAKYLPSISLPVFVAAYKTMIAAAQRIANPTGESK